MTQSLESVIFFSVGIFLSATVFGIFIFLSNKKSKEKLENENRESERMRQELNDYLTSKKIAEEKLSILERNQGELKQEHEGRIHQLENLLQQKEDVIRKMNADLATKMADLKNINEKLQNQKAEVENIREKFQTEFKNLANDIFEEKGKKFTEQNQTNISEVLKPLNEKIKDFERKVEETYDKESKQRFSLKEEVKRLAELNQQVSHEASNLTKALKGQAKTQGNWGELILENILEKSGLAKDREYFVQQSYQTIEGKRLQPDVVVSYPGGRNVVIDSKVSLVAYERYSSSEIEEEQEQARKAHLLSVKNHIVELAAKNYQDLYQLSSLDFVMLFMPIEPAYLVAIQSDQ